MALSLPEIGAKASWPFASRACWPCPFQESDRRPPGLSPPGPAGPVPSRNRIEGLLAFDGIERNRVRYVFDLAGNHVLLGRVAALEEDADEVRDFHGFRYAARSWKGNERRVIARIEATRQGSDTRFVVTNLTGTPRWLYEVLYCGRGPSAASWPRSFQESDRASADARWSRTCSRRTNSISPRTVPRAARRRPTSSGS